MNNYTASEHASSAFVLDTITEKIAWHQAEILRLEAAKAVLLGLFPPESAPKRLGTSPPEVPDIEAVEPDPAVISEAERRRTAILELLSGWSPPRHPAGIAKELGFTVKQTQNDLYVMKKSKRVSHSARGYSV